MEGLAKTAADLILKAGGVPAAICVILAGVVVYLYRGKEALHAQFVVLTEATAKIAERANTTIGALTATIEARNVVLSEITRTIDAIVQTVEAEGELNRERIEELRRALERLERRP